MTISPPQGLVTPAQLSSQRLNTIGLIGDSITNNNGSITAYLFRSGYWSWSNTFLGHRFNLTYIDGVAGSGCLNVGWQNRVNTLISNQPAWVVIQIGTNDIYANGTDVDIINALTITINKFIAAGIRPIICTIPPRNDLSTSTQRTYRAYVNTWIRRTPSIFPGIIVVDISSYLTDPANSTYANYVPSFSSDGVHPNAAGCRQMGLAFYNALNTVSVPFANLTMSQSEGGNRISYNAASWAGGASAQPSGWTGTNTATWSQMARTDNIQGIVERVVIPNGGSISLHVPFGGYSVGDKFVGFLEMLNVSNLDTAPAANTQGMTIYLVSYTSTYSVARAVGELYANGTEVNAPPPTGVLQTPILTVPSTGLQEIDLFIEIKGGGTYDLGRVGVVKVN